MQQATPTTPTTQAGARPKPHQTRGLLQPNERRYLRSESPSEAANYQLLHCAHRFDMPVLCLSDERGMLLANAWGDDEMGGVLSAYAPLLCRTQDLASRAELLRSLRDFLPSLGQRRLSVRRFEIAGHEMFLCALGERGALKDEGLVHAIHGLRRILH